MTKKENNYGSTESTIDASIAMDTRTLIGEPYDYEAEKKRVWDKIYSNEKSKSKYRTKYTPPKKRNRKK